MARDHDVVEKNRTSADRFAAEIVVAQRRDARGVHRHEEGADAARAALRRAGPREQHNGVGLVGHADRRLLAFQDIAVAFAAGGEREIGGVRSAARFCKPDRHDDLAGNETRQPLPRQFRPGVTSDDLAVERAEDLDVGSVDVGVADRFGDQAAGQARCAEPAEFLGEFGCDQPEIAHFTHERAIDAAFDFSTLVSRRELLARKAPGCLLESKLIVSSGRSSSCTTPRQPAIVRPPETLSTWPVMNAASSLAKKQIAPGRSAGAPMRPSGIERRNASFSFSGLPAA